MAKDQQLDVEVQLKSRLKEIQEKIDLGLPIDEHGLNWIHSELFRNFQF